jgi:hypothetical protein
VDRSVERWTALGLVGEELALEVDQRGRNGPRLGRRKLLNGALCETSQVLHGSLERRERRTSRLIRERHDDLGSRGQPFEQRPLRPGQVFEAVCENGLAVPGIQIGCKALGGAAPEAVAVPQTKAVELSTVGDSQPAEIAVEAFGLEKRRLDLPESRCERVREAARSGRRGKVLESSPLYRATDCERALRLGRDRPLVVPAERVTPASDVLEEVVERADPAAEERCSTPKQVAFDPFDVPPVRYDEPRVERRIDVQGLEIPIEKQRNLAGVRRPHDERERHLPIVVLGSDAPSYGVRRLSAKCENFGPALFPPGETVFLSVTNG